MTHSKVLQMLDHVMLWIARGFAILFSIFGSLTLVFLIDYAHKHPGAAEAVSLITALDIMYISWGVALWLLSHSLARTYLQITILIYLAVSLLGYVGFLDDLLRPDLSLFRLILAGSIAIFWTATRSQPHSNPVLPPIPHASF
jgi:hypothetical protein